MLTVLFRRVAILCVDHAESNTLISWNVLSFDFDLARTGLVSFLLSRTAAGGVIGLSIFNTCAIFDNRKSHEMLHPRHAKSTG